MRSVLARCLRLRSLAVSAGSARWARPRPAELFDDEAPSGAPLQGEGHVGSPVEALEPRRPRWRSAGAILPRAHLAAVGVEIVERDLPAVNVQPSYDAHGDLLVLRHPVFLTAAMILRLCRGGPPASRWVGGKFIVL